ncbi:hypothetical protein CONLIGDRAFT_360269 [Coniochaeta ligniaria NRRL 30616]|uniref:Eisosome protein 1 n=1 Tax=Coniochaeta ligniaria NRRL 30616 TaxID=1408157 RepID=A0A1J7IRF8_9PEZI|nr:hypothetical protein CONLIGDRAFT_360269 [Coniochaeta ligniaria NRRL 30616]
MMQAVSANQSHIPPGHSGRIRYASPQELPSYPSTGLKEDGAAAGAAASLGWANQKSIEPWKPSSSSSASLAAHLANDHQRTIEPWKPASSASAASAALLANDYKMPPVRETKRSSAPYQAATLAAASAASALNSPRQEPVSPRSGWGNSAANQAFQAANASASHAHADESYALSRQQSLRGATGAVAGSRPRSISTPQKYTYPDQANASANALSAANRASVRSKFDEAGSVPYTNMAREMFTSHPPVKLEVEEKQHADSLHASAVAMAKRIYTQQQKAIDSAKNNNNDASTAAARSSSFSRHGAVSPVSSNEQVSTGFPNLQEAAYRLAQERLAKLHDEHQKERGYQDYYGAPNSQRNAGRLGTIRGKLTRRRSSSDGDLVDDHKRSQQIRQEMSMFSTTLSKVDEEKRTNARQALLAAAQRNVKAQMEGMDQKLYENTGRVPPSRLNDWEMKAHSAALMRVEVDRDVNEGKIDLGAGVFMTQEEVNAIAAKRIQPVLDDINRKAEAERERQLTVKLDEEHRKEEAEREKGRDREIQDIHKKLKDQQKDEEKRIKAEAKAAERARKDCGFNCRGGRVEGEDGGDDGD